MRILVVEDDEFVAYALTAVLSSQNYAVEVASDGQVAWDLVQTFNYDLIILDLILPKLDGISLCRQIRFQGLKTPILLLTGRDSSHDKAVGLDAGADDYLVKPFDSEELFARVRALLRRGGLASQPVLEWGDLQLDPSSCEVTYAQKQLALTPKEYALLELFLRNSRRVFSCGMILEHLWSYEDTPSEEAVRTHIKGLRQKLKAAVGKSDLIETVYGIGYRLKPLEKKAGEAGGDNQKSQEQTIAAVAGVWQRFKGRVAEQINVLEQAAQALSVNTLSQELQESAQTEAHTLAGALGTFGLAQGSKLAREIESLLRADRVLEPIEASALRALVLALRQAIQPPREAIDGKAKVTDSEQPLLLVVDRDSSSAEQLTAAATERGLRVAIANNLGIARNKLYQEHPSVVLLNPNVSPDFEDSSSLLTELSQRQPPVPVLVFTEQTDLNNRLQVARSGGYTFLQKSIPPEQVLNAVAQALENAPHAEAHVLAVDDDAKILSVLQKLLSPWGLRVTTLDDPRRFWETLEATSPDLLILDVEMPQINGIELCQVVRNDPRWSNLPILFLTVHNDAEILDRVFGAGADDFVNKPIVGPELVTRIVNRLERIKLLRRMTQTQQKLEHSADSQSIAILRASEERLRWALEAAHIGIWDWDLVTNKIIWSLSHEQLFGLAPGTFDGTYETFNTCILPSDRVALTQIVNTARQEQKEYCHEFRVLWQDGSIHWIEGRGKFFYNKAGIPVRMLGTVRDISARKIAEVGLNKTKDGLELRVAERTAELIKVNEQLQLELNQRQRTQEALLDSQALFAGIVEIADDAIISIDSNQCITLFNSGAEKIFGYSAAEVIGQPLDLLLPMRFVAAHRQHVAEFEQSPSLARRMGERREIYGCHKDGKEFPAEATISKLNLGGKTVYTVYLRDVSDRKQIERMKDEFVSVVSHELRTPLTSIHGSLGMLASGLLQPDSQQGKRLLQIATDSTERLVRLINDVLDIERIESGKVKMEKYDCNVADLIEEAVNIMQPLATKAGITLAVSKLPIQIWADPDRIVQTLTNLLSNAIKFSPAGASVWLTASIEETSRISPPASPAVNPKEILFKVQDQGRGIPADKLESIFERFQQVDSTDSRKHDGTGLGLVICRSIVQQHGGRIWVESVLGESSTFYFTLPILPAMPDINEVSDQQMNNSFYSRETTP